jgi:hypothetical protein
LLAPKTLRGTSVHRTAIADHMWTFKSVIQTEKVIASSRIQGRSEVQVYNFWRIIKEWKERRKEDMTRVPEYDQNDTRDRNGRVNHAVQSHCCGDSYSDQIVTGTGSFAPWGYRRRGSIELP